MKLYQLDNRFKPLYDLSFKNELLQKDILQNKKLLTDNIETIHRKIYHKQEVYDDIDNLNVLTIKIIELMQLKDKDLVLNTFKNLNLIKAANILNHYYQDMKNNYYLLNINNNLENTIID